ncbi:hypothetical protein [Paenibacillus polymyxa]|uniref:hypothetical protein n=1 Tax=Paenibacillus polymyxa TaxID=1406 RepID=UPI00287F89A9|nr:hypothetical protein [Paenibacillus polymyxa]
MFGVFAVEKFWNLKNKNFYVHVAATIKHLSWKNDLSKIENKSGLIIFYSFNSDKKLVIDYVSTSCNLSRRMAELSNEHSHYFKKCNIAYAYEQSRTKRYIKRNLLHSLRLPKVKKVS